MLERYTSKQVAGLAEAHMCTDQSAGWAKARATEFKPV